MSNESLTPYGEGTDFGLAPTPEVDAFLRAGNCSRDNPIAFDWLVGLARSLERRAHPSKTVPKFAARELAALGLAGDTASSETRWIPVSERLPHGVEKPLLVYGDNELLIMGIFNGPDSVFLGWDDEAEDWREIPARVTHWMVIPETPK